MRVPVRMVDLSLAVYHYEMELASRLYPLLDDFAFWGPPRPQDPGYRFGHPLPPFEGVSVHRLGLGARERRLGLSGTTIDYALNQFLSLLVLQRMRQKPIVHVQFLSFLQKRWWDITWLRLVKRRARALLYTVHNLLPHDLEHDQVLRSKYRQVYHLVDHLIVHTEFQRQQLVGQFDVSPANVSVLPLGPSFTQFTLPDKAHAQQTLGVKPPVFLHFGSMRPYKGTETLLRAFAQLKQSHTPGTLVLAGPAPVARQNELQSLVAELHLQDNVLYRFDFIPAPEVPLYFAAADVVVLPYVHIDQSAVLPTALAWGLPAVVSEVGGFSEFIGANDFGYLCSPCSSDSLVTALLDVLQDLPCAREKARRAQTFVNVNHNWDVISQHTMELYAQFA